MFSYFLVTLWKFKDGFNRDFYAKQAKYITNLQSALLMEGIHCTSMDLSCISEQLLLHMCYSNSQNYQADCETDDYQVV